MDDFKEQIIIANNEPDFMTNTESGFSATYFILCKNDTLEEENINKAKICGLTLTEWVAMACENKPILLNISENQNILDLVRPYVNNSEYFVILYSNTPLITKTHLKDLLNFVVRKRFNACKLKKGYILRSDYVLDAEKLYANFAYDLVTNDFLEVNSIYDIDTARTYLEKRIFNYHINKGVLFENRNTVNLDSSVKLGSGSEIGGNVTIQENTTIGENVKISANCAIINSKIGANCKIGVGAIIENSIIKDGTEILSGTNINHSVIGENVKIENSVKIIDSSLGNNTFIGSFCNLCSANVSPSANIAKFSNIAGIGLTIVVDEDANIPAFSNIVKFDKK